jgi:GNAT superfamily N-acetyltransferase
VTSEPEPAGVAEALAAERGFVRLFGGYTVGLAGGTLLVNERLPVPRFNVVQAVRVARERQTAFFEAALDHYFQRALRPAFRVSLPVPPHVDNALRQFAFRPRPDPEVWLVAGPDRPMAEKPSGDPGPAGMDRLDQLVDLWVGPGERIEFRRQLEVGWLHPNPGERLVPFASCDADGQIASAGLAYRRGSCLDLEAVVTRPGARGRGSATALVERILADPLGKQARFVALRSALPRLAERLGPDGFRVADRCAVYELPPEAELTLRLPPPHTDRLWRPRPKPSVA